MVQLADARAGGLVAILREERLERNQKLFRRANEGLENAVGDKVPAEQALPFLCECADDECTRSVSLTLSSYEQVRSNQNQFFIVPGHLTIPGERVVSEEDGYTVVEKGDAHY